MIIIYVFRRNNYAATLAAYLHLQMNIPEKIKQYPLKSMKLYYVGMDEQSRAVYLLKYNIRKNILMNILHGLGNIFNEEIKIINLEKFDGYLAHILRSYGIPVHRKKIEDYINENNI